MPNHPTTELLSDEQIAEIEARLKLWVEHEIPHSQYPASWEEVSTLCATVRAQQDLLQLADYAAEEFRRQAERIIVEVERERDALREQLAQSQSDNERLALAMQSVEEREAAVCPEDVGFDEYIRTLGKQLAQLKEALTTLQNCQNKPRCENCANLIRATLEKL